MDQKNLTKICEEGFVPIDPLTQTFMDIPYMLYKKQDERILYHIEQDRICIRYKIEKRKEEL